MELNKKIKFNNIPNSAQIKDFITLVKKYLFVGYFEAVDEDYDSYRNQKLKEITKMFAKYIDKNKANEFVNQLPTIEKDLSIDLDFFFDSDPACQNKEEVVYTYPGYLAIVNYRIAHAIYKLGIPLVPRIISERAHSITGIDIHPGAEIGVPFFIDHGTGIVIGQTAEVGKYVKMYHGVTLGALSLREGRKLSGKKRHPTIKDYVTIYSGASILGGDTIIGERVTIGSNVFIVNSVLEDTTVIYQENQTKFINK